MARSSLLASSTEEILLHNCGVNSLEHVGGPIKEAVRGYVGLMSCLHVSFCRVCHDDKIKDRLNVDTSSNLKVFYR